MRTTVTLDPDVERQLRNEVRRRGEPFKQVLNNAIRAGLKAARARPQPYRPLTFDMGVPRVDLSKALTLAADLEDEELLRRYERAR
jgi:hypothetical protein